MAHGYSRTLTLGDEAETAAFAGGLAPHLAAGDVLALHGQIGAGKSVFARAVIDTRLSASGQREDIPSPTFTLVQTYLAGALEIWHADLYRLSDPGEVAELGLADAFDTALCLIEWPDRLGDALPTEALHVSLASGESDRTRRLTMDGPRTLWADRLDAACASFAAEAHV